MLDKTSKKQIAVIPVMLLFFLGQSDVQIIAPILAQIRETFSVSIARAGSSVSVYSVIAAGWALFVGPMSDRHGRFVFLLVSAGLLALASLVAGATASFQGFLFSRVIAGLAGATISVCTTAWLADRTSYARRGQAMGWLGAVNVLAAIVVAPAAVLIADSEYGWRVIYALVGALACIALLAMLLMDGTKEEEHQLRQSRAHQEPWQRAFIVYRSFFTRSSPRNGLVLAVLISSSVMSVVTYLGVWLKSGLFESGSRVAEAFLVLGICSIAGAVLGGQLADRVGKRALIALTGILLTGVLLAVPVVTTFSRVLGFVAAGGLLFGMREGSYQALMTGLIPADERGAYLAMKSTAAKLGIAFSVTVSGLAYTAWGFGAVTSFAALCAALSTALIPFIKTDPATSSVNPGHK